MPEKKPPDDAVPSDEEGPAPQDDELAQIREQLEEALREKDQFRSMAQRAQADLVNYRRRAAEEREEALRSARSELLLRTLSFADDMDRALSLIPEDAVAPGWLDGLRLAKRNLSGILDSAGVTKIEAEGQPFEPWEHEAVAFEETSEADEGIVIRVIRDGYKLHDKVLRAAQVAVSKSPELNDNQEQTGQEG